MSFAKASKMMGSLDNAAHFSKGVKTSKGCPKDCFVAGTLIKTEEGYKAIEEIEVGDKVWSWDEETGEQALKTVVQLFRNTKTVKTTVTIESEDGTVDEIVSTPGHKYYLPLNRANRNPKEELEHASYEGLTEQWVSACELKAGDRVVLAQSGELTEKVKYGIVKEVQTEQCEKYTTYNFEVEEYHTYFVGKICVCVHNAGCGDNFKKYTSDEIAKKYNISSNDFHRKVKRTIIDRARPNYKVGNNPNIMLDKAHNIAYQGAKGKGFQETGLNMLEILMGLGLR